MTRFALLVAVATILVSTPSSTFAEDIPLGDARAAQVIVTDPNYGQQPQPTDPYYGQQQQQQVQVVEEESPARQGRGFEYGGSLYVPIWIGDVGDYLNPGIGIDLRAGWELGGGLSIDGHLGFTYNSFKSAWLYDSSLQSAYLGAGFRYAFLNRSAIVPFLQLGLQLNLWSICYDVNCGSEFSTVNFGAYGGGGVLYEVNEFMSVDLGLDFMTTLGDDGGIFEGFETSVRPFIGLTLYY